MEDYTQTYNFSSLYLPVLAILFYACSSNYDTFVWIMHKIYYDSSLNAICALIGVLVVLSKIHFEITLKCSFK